MVGKKKDLEREDEEIVPESTSFDDSDISLEDSENTAKDIQKALREKLRACEKEKLEHLDALQRTKADFLNSKRRLEEQSKRDIERATFRMLEQLLPLADSFDMAMANTEVWERADEVWRKGIEGINSQLQSILKSHDVAAIDKTGEMFNPHIHEAITEVPVDDAAAKGTVIAIIQKGYTCGETVIRPARVAVGA